MKNFLSWAYSERTNCGSHLAKIPCYTHNRLLHVQCLKVHNHQGQTAHCWLWVAIIHSVIYEHRPICQLNDCSLRLRYSCTWRQHSTHVASDVTGVLDGIHGVTVLSMFSSDQLIAGQEGNGQMHVFSTGGNHVKSMTVPGSYMLIDATLTPRGNIVCSIQS